MKTQKSIIVSSILKPVKIFHGYTIKFHKELDTYIKHVVDVDF